LSVKAASIVKWKPFLPYLGETIEKGLPGIIGYPGEP